MFPLLLSLGILYLLALGAGRLAARFNIPRVTGYLLVGLAAGPSIAGIIGIPSIITKEQLDGLEPLHDLILGLIVLVIGGSFHTGNIRKFGIQLLKVSTFEILITGGLVWISAFVAGASLMAAGFLAIMAMTTAPAATQMVVREYEAEGRLTDLIMSLIGANNLVAIFAFIALAHVVVTPDAPIWNAVIKIVLPLGLGLVAGTFLALMDQRFTRKTDRQILVLAAVASLVGVCRFWDVSSMLAAMVAGMVLINTSPHERRIFNDLSAVDYPLYVIFFIMAGSHLHLEHLPQMGAVGIAYIVSRLIGKIAGCYFGATVGGCPITTKQWLGPGMLAQAGLAIGLASILARQWGAEGRQIQSAILASVVVFEGIGPLLTRISLIKAGEVTVLGILTQRSPVGYAEGLHQVINHFADALGSIGKKPLEKASDILISHVMRRNTEVIKYDIDFDGILKTLGHSRYDRLPVVDDNGDLLGVIQYKDVSKVLLDPLLKNLIVAKDIANQEHFLLTPQDSLSKAMEELREHPDHTYMLVVDKDNPQKLIGTVRQNDVLSAQRRIKPA